MAKNNNLKDFLTGVANAIRTKKGTTALINPQDFESEIASIETGGGEQPTLFAPVITAGVNTVSWENNSQNGGFPVTLSAEVDGTSVEKPLTITEDMDGKTLSINASSENFISNSTSVKLAHLNPATSIFSSVSNFKFGLMFTSTFGINNVTDGKENTDNIFINKGDLGTSYSDEKVYVVTSVPSYASINLIALHSSFMSYMTSGFATGALHTGGNLSGHDVILTITNLTQNKSATWTINSSSSSSNEVSSLSSYFAVGDQITFYLSITS